MKTQVKICGIRSLDIAHKSVEAGADFLGFNFINESKRYITPENAKPIIDHVKGKIKLVGIFRNQDAKFINAIVKMTGLELVQLHGSESADFCQTIEAAVIKVFPISQSDSIDNVYKKMKQYNVKYYLIDRIKQGKGAMISTRFAKSLSQYFPIFFAGGLTIDTVKRIVDEVQPFAVDVAGGIETQGNPDQKKIKSFIEMAK